jgi:hypothetical protein
VLFIFSGWAWFPDVMQGFEESFFIVHLSHTFKKSEELALLI